MWEPFTERARRAFIYAQEKSVNLNQWHVGTGHLLYGILVSSEDPVGLEALRRSVDIDRLKSDLEFMLSTAPKDQRDETFFTPNAKESIELAFKEAREFFHNYVGTEHLVAGLFHSPDSETVTPYDVAHEVLGRYTTIAEYRKNMIRILGVKEAPVKEPTPYDQYLQHLVYMRDERNTLVGVLSAVNDSTFLFHNAVTFQDIDADKALESYNLLMTEKSAAVIEEFYVSLKNPKVHSYMPKVLTPEN